MKGFIKLPRELTREEFYYSNPFVRPRALLDLILLASYKERILRKGNAEIKIGPGELAYSTQSLAKRWNRSRHFVRNVLCQFASMGLIEVKTNSHTTIVKIKNWEEFQYLPEPERRPDCKPPAGQCEGIQQTETPGTVKCAASDPETRGLAAFLLSEIRKNDPYLVIPDGARWDLEIGRIISESGIPPEELKRVIELSQNHPFWKKHVNSPSTLRLHFHALFVEMNEKTKSNKHVPDEWRLCYER